MFVLIATSETNGIMDDDYRFTVDGELVVLPLLECDSPGCGCDRGWAGLGSQRATTTAMVLDRPDLDRATYRSLIADHWDEQIDGYSLAEDGEYLQSVDAFIDVVQSIGVRSGEGAIVRRRPGGVLEIAIKTR